MGGSSRYMDLSCFHKASDGEVHAQIIIATKISKSGRHGGYWLFDHTIMILISVSCEYGLIYLFRNRWIASTSLWTNVYRHWRSWKQPRHQMLWKLLSSKLWLYLFVSFSVWMRFRWNTQKSFFISMDDDYSIYCKRLDHVRD